MGMKHSTRTHGQDALALAIALALAAAVIPAGAAAQQAAAGAKAVGIVVGTRYIHTVTEMIEKGDLEAAKDILVAYLSQA